MKLMKDLKNKKILLIIGGGIAAYKSLELIRSLKKYGSQVEVILTSSGRKFVTELSVSQLAESEVHTDLFDSKSEIKMGHINLSRNADVIVVAPATANLISRLAYGMADELATATLLASNKPIIIVPAMNPQMWNNPATKKNLMSVKKFGVHFCGPEIGETACGEKGMGRMEEPGSIANYINEYFSKKDKLKNRKAFVTAGPTIEPIDPVRYISNNSSGKQGYAIASALSKYGANTTLISGPSFQEVPEGVELIKVKTATEMLDAVKASSPADIGIFAAAVVDWKIKEYKNNKIKKDGYERKFELIENISVIQSIVKNNSLKPKLSIGFAAETENIYENAKEKYSKNDVDWLLANDVSEDQEVFDGDYNSIVFFDRSGSERWQRMPKVDVAEKLVDKISGYFQ
jgi:phosphopantothenoylcysteine decarboxylase/phosphopantothenate--cysteine ligase